MDQGDKIFKNFRLSATGIEEKEKNLHSHFQWDWLYAAAMLTVAMWKQGHFSFCFSKTLVSTLGTSKKLSEFNMLQKNKKINPPLYPRYPYDEFSSTGRHEEVIILDKFVCIIFWSQMIPEQKIFAFINQNFYSYPSNGLQYIRISIYKLLMKMNYTVNDLISTLC